MSTTKADVLDYLKARKRCDGKCIYNSFCPEYPPPNTGLDCPCAILSMGNIDTFYNVFFAEGDGIKNELQRTLYSMSSSSDPEDYLTACIKTFSTVYSEKKEVAPPEIHINIEDVRNEVTAKTRNEMPQKPVMKSRKKEK